MLFKPEHVQMILEGKKTQTRRMWKRRMVKIGGVYKCKTKMFTKDYFAKIRVIDLYITNLDNISIQDVKEEGYNTTGEFFEVFKKINPYASIKDAVWVVKFEVV